MGSHCCIRAEVPHTCLRSERRRLKEAPCTPSEPFEAFRPTIRLLLVNQLGIDVGFYLLIPYLSTHLSDDLHPSAAATGAILGARQLSQHGLFVVGGTAADRLGAHRVIPVRLRGAHGRLRAVRLR
ncbi:hypothetical protein LT493_08850 [Streptomyces tricolor]|nr:hypothetical protein [Streptomyces tricolor]